MEEKPWESSESERENMNKTHWLAYRQARKQLSRRARNGAEGGGLFQPAEWRKISGEQGATVEVKGKGQADLARAYSNFQGRTRPRLRCSRPLKSGLKHTLWTPSAKIVDVIL